MRPIPRPVCGRLGSPDAEVDFGNKMFISDQGQGRGRRKDWAE